MPKPISVAGYDFPTKGAAKEFIAALRDRYPDGVIIPDPDSAFLTELLTIHPEAPDKIGCGISHFTVATDSVFRRTRHFVVHRTDGKHTDFSFHSCVDGRNHRRDRLEAMRRAIESSILRFRDATFAAGQIVCPFSGAVLAPQTCHIDHSPPMTFLALVERWLTSLGLSIEDVAITPPADNQTVTRMIDRVQMESWVDFHDRHATLRAISPRANLSDAKLHAKTTKG